MSESVLDSSALLAYLRQEPGESVTEQAIRDGAAISTVNLAETVTKLNESGIPDAEVRQMVDSLILDVIPFDQAQAFQTGFLRAATRSLGLSLGDRACIALAEHLGVPALTADRQWAALNLAIAVRLIR